MAKAMILSVGGSPEPLVKTILHHRPEYICYFCSQASVDVVSKIKDGVKEQAPELKITDHKVVADDPEDLDKCYVEAQKCREKLEEWQVDAKDVVVDYTGGTKNMSVAVALATIRYNYRFSYVGGKERTKEGLGIVKSGAEEIKTGGSPWTLFAIEESRQIAELFNHYQFSAVRRSIENLTQARDLNPRLKNFLEILYPLCQSYICWESFQLKQATEKLSACSEELSKFVEYGNEKYRQFLNSVKGNLNWLNRIQNHTKGFRVLHYLQVWDLVSNAERRAEEGKYDDAVARLYRSLEMIAQIEAAKDSFLNIENASNVRKEQIPIQLREEYIRKYKDSKTDQLKIPCQALFNLLAHVNNKVGLAYKKNEEEFRKLLSARNDSILAHGQTPVSESTYMEFHGYICDNFEIIENVQFAKLEFSL